NPAPTPIVRRFQLLGALVWPAFWSYRSAQARQFPPLASWAPAGPREDSMHTERRSVPCRSLIGAAVIAAAMTAFSASSSAETFVTFDVPGAAATVPSSINNKGDIAGHYVSSDTGDTIGFHRDPN